jgi:hypothetical protein
VTLSLFSDCEEEGRKRRREERNAGSCLTHFKNVPSLHLVTLSLSFLSDCEEEGRRRRREECNAGSFLTCSLPASRDIVPFFSFRL